MKRRNIFIISMIVAVVVVVVGVYYFVLRGEEMIVIGSKPLTEQFIVAHMMALLLEERGYETKVREPTRIEAVEWRKGTLINYEALKRGQIHAYVEYTGTAYNEILKLPPLEAWSPEEVYQQCEEGLMDQDEVVIATRLGFRRDYAIAVRNEWAETNEVSKISELASFAPDMILGTNPEFATRADGLPQINSIYGFTFKDVKQIEPALMFEAIRNNQVDAITAYTTDRRVDLFNLRILEDDGRAFPPYDAIIIVKKDFASKSDIMEQLSKLEGEIDTGTMRQLLYLYVTAEAPDVRTREEEACDTARRFLIDNALIQDLASEEIKDLGVEAAGMQPQLCLCSFECEKQPFSNSDVFRGILSNTIQKNLLEDKVDKV